ncbi:glycosyltransferase family 2 protein [Leeuwenhoekiella sp. W20_SRS_FM14]|uniref:glycosyltransferase family 2 protein n=1 Tax=Leeuwenhoekiella sp. W20_SRS_FM14 TaxID=3240270 RepID=UPI003F9B5B7F
MEKKVSIVIPCYNDVRYIETAVNSAFAQTYDCKEIIVVDDGSDQETKNILKNLKVKITHLITQENRGQAAARNLGISQARGEFILVLDSDDYFEPDFCKKAVSVLQNPKVSLVTCFARCFNEKTEWIYKPQGGSIENFLFSNASLGNAALFRKTDWQEVGGYDERMCQGWEDWEFYIRLLNAGGECFVIPEVLFNYRKRDNSTTKTANAHKYELYRYIFLKHKELYFENYSSTIDFFLDKVAFEEREKLKNLQRIDYRLGKKILYPLRAIKKIWK